MRRRRRSTTGPADILQPEYQDFAELWGLRMLLGLQAYRRKIMHKHGDEVMEFLDLDMGCTAPSSKELKELLSVRLKEAERDCPDDLGRISENLALLGKVISLNGTDQQILEFFIVVNEVPRLNEIVCFLAGDVDLPTAGKLLAMMLKLPEEDVRRSLAADGILLSSGLLSLSKRNSDLGDKLALLDSFGDTLKEPHQDCMEMLKPFFRFPEPATLTREDYPHFSDGWSLIREYLWTASQERRRGVNILIHGTPGTGKTEFTRAVTAELGLELCEVSSEDDGDGASCKQRLRAYLLAQNVLGESANAVLLFDEVEDVFPTRQLMPFGSSSGGAIAKSEMNRVLEDNRTPAFWLSNHVSQMDPAYLRRFDLVLEMPPPPRDIRRKILSRYLDGVPIGEEWLNRQAENPKLMPASIETAAKVVRTLKPGDPNSAEERMDFILRGSLEAMGCPPPARSGFTNPIAWRLEYLNTDVDLAALAEGLSWRKQGRLCLFGPPGAGKSAFGQHVADVLKRPLLIKRASDLLDMYVGGTEKAIAAMFREAEREKAVLLLDEADSFLRDRRKARQSWEVTQVNELLTQMEAFDGIFIASTNLMGDLDAASLRRFDFKVRFDYMRAEQRRKLFEAAKTALQVKGDTDAAAGDRLNRLDTLTPGDFAVAARQASLRKTPLTQDELLEILEAECAAKKGGSRPIGFLESGH